MDFSKWTSIIKMILLKIVDEIERRINEKNGNTTSNSFASTVFSSLKFIVLDQVDGLVGQVENYAKKQIEDLSDVIAAKVSKILASMVYVLILVGLFFLGFIFLIIALSLYLGALLGNNYYGFLISGGITFLILIIILFTGHKYISEKVRVKLDNVM